jgi:arginine deiminase
MTRPRSSGAIPNDRILFGEAYWWNQARKHRRLAVMLRAYGVVARSLPRLLAKRREVQSRRRVALQDLDRFLRRAGHGA